MIWLYEDWMVAPFIQLYQCVGTCVVDICTLRQPATHTSKWHDCKMKLNKLSCSVLYTTTNYYCPVFLMRASTPLFIRQIYLKRHAPFASIVIHNAETNNRWTGYRNKRSSLPQASMYLIRLRCEIIRCAN